MNGGTTFDNHRGVVPLLWVFFALAVCEMLAVHLFVALKWPWIGWPLTLVSLASVIWLIRWIGSWKRLPHRLNDRELVLHMGALRSVSIPLDAIGRILPMPSLDALKTMRAMKLVPLAHPNRLIELRRPIMRKDVIALRFDDPEAFDTAMRLHGLAVDT